MESLLGRIINNRKIELETVRKEIPLDHLRDECAGAEPARGFAAALKKASPAIIAELKKASPTKGLLCPDFDVEKLAAAYSAGGAAAMSVLTEMKYFQGDLSYIRRAKKVSPLPALRKDFIFDEYQVFEARAAGADAILLIAASLEASHAADLAALAHELGMDVLLEVHDADEIAATRNVQYDVIGVNNRNLKTGVVSIETSLALAGEIPPGACKISESGIKNSADIKMLSAAGYSGFLIGETLVVSGEPEKMLMELLR